MINSRSNRSFREDERSSYRLRFEKGLIISLILVILVFEFSKKIPEKDISEYSFGFGNMIYVDPMPQTSRKKAISQAPRLPQVPIPSEDEYIPEDETIDETLFDMSSSIEYDEGKGGSGGFGSGSIGDAPRPIREVIPEYPRREKKRGIEGVIELWIRINKEGRVDSVRVLKNTSKNKNLERAAVNAALKSIYVPAERHGKKINLWIRRKYKFEKKR